MLIHADPGSSPRVRGKPPTRPCARPRGGLIPACAGKTSSSPRAPSRAWAHPRVCGENFLAYFQEMRPDGSSPRVRGKPVGDAGDEVAEGLIPACAGKTPSAAKRALMSAAHPRVCGENWSTASRRSTASGSSPRVRGKRVRAVADGGGARLIPACAGKTPPTSGTSGPRTAHPRVCGENIGRRGVADVQRGSSPRVRGKRGARRGGGVRVGLIPACAGKTPPPGVPASPRAAHPRVCGENLRRWRGARGGLGSSPRVRGKPRVVGVGAPPAGLIPACAGKTCLWCRPRRR